MTDYKTIRYNTNIQYMKTEQEKEAATAELTGRNALQAQKLFWNA